MPAFRSTVPQSTVTSDKEVDPVASEPSPSSNSKGSRFWLCFLAILVSVFLSALDFSAMPTALPTITAELHGGDNFVWVGSGYGLASAAFLLLAGTLADIMGRKPVLLASIALFSVGSALAGASQNMNMLIAARVIQGVGDLNLPLDGIAFVLVFFSAFIHGITSISAIFYVPTYAQACLGASSLRSSVDTLPIALVVPAFAMLSGLAIKSMNKYRPVIVLGWVLSIVGFGILSLLKADSSVGAWVGFQIVVAVGTGFVYTSTVFPILAPLSVSRNAAALAFFTFCRAFAQTWGVAISGAILQNQLKDKLPPAFTAQFPSGVQIAYAVIPTIGDLEPALRTTVRDAFADSLSVIWKTMAGLCGVAILSLVLLKEVPMVKHTDEKYGLEEASAAKAPVTDTEIVLTPKVEP
ncbi:hypothetical protein BN946_scf185011.g9 [Trametes cinnabarina]|uniref:Major facilitator superfamily (MFS) profile domain-containing protein n=1 Tax=Pycnoporus cinnabarinus TaxID=5643 RepID=A0A060SPR9_PYCCI|nr:hypothetical protein BN946_scf185011.g9 [Trametes cinnabarina]